MNKQIYIMILCGALFLSSISLTLADTNADHPTISFGEFSPNFHARNIPLQEVKPIQIQPDRNQWDVNEDNAHQQNPAPSLYLNSQITRNTQDETNPSIAMDYENNHVLLYALTTSSDQPINKDIMVRKSVQQGAQWPEDLIYSWDTDSLSEINPVISMMDDGKRAYGTHEIEDGGQYLYLHEYLDIDDHDSWVMSHFDLTPEITNVRDTTITTYGSNTTVIGGVVDLAYHEFRLKDTMVLFWSSEDGEDNWPGLFLINENDEGTQSYPISDIVADAEETIYVAFKLVDEGKDDNLYVAFCQGNNTVFENWNLGYITGGRGNISNPSIDVTRGIAYVVFEEERFGSTDIICYTTMTGTYWRRSIISSSFEDEINPVISASGEHAVCVFSKQGNLYESRSENGGLSWGSPQKINYYDGSVSKDPKSIDVERYYTVWSDTRNGNSDLFMHEVGALPILSMSDISGGFSIRASVTNVGNALEETIEWSIQVDGPAIPEKKTGIIQNLYPNEKETVKMNILFGFGTIDITVSIGEFTKTVQGFVAGSYVFLSKALI